MAAIQAKNTDGVLGRDMGELMAVIENDDVYVNGKQVGEEIGKERKAVDEIVVKLRQVLNEGALRLTDLRKKQTTQLSQQ